MDSSNRINICAQNLCTQKWLLIILCSCNNNNCPTAILFSLQNELLFSYICLRPHSIRLALANNGIYASKTRSQRKREKNYHFEDNAEYKVYCSKFGLRDFLTSARCVGLPRSESNRDKWFGITKCKWKI